jgi:hypothetical protein
MADNSLMWVEAKVVRLRPIHNGLYECGLQFIAKAEDFLFSGNFA